MKYKIGLNNKQTIKIKRSSNIIITTISSSSSSSSISISSSSSTSGSRNQLDITSRCLAATEHHICRTCNYII
jgi:hypothetical protein